MNAPQRVRSALGGLALVAIAAASGGLSSQGGLSPSPVEPTPEVTPSPLVIGPTARVTEASTGLDLVARVDTGARTTSLHCTEDDLQIQDASSDPLKNLGKPVRIRVENRQGHSDWVETELVDYVEVRSANGAERRYRVWLPLSCGPVTKETLVNLNDRSAMTYRLLLGRDFLEGDFLVDVSRAGAPAF